MSVGGGDGDHEMDWHSIKGGVVKLLVASCEETRFISSQVLVILCLCIPPILSLKGKHIYFATV